MNPNLKPLLAALAVVFASDAAAQTLYKLIDKNGKVTYSEEQPKSFDGQVIRIDIDPNANTATLPKPPKPPAPKKGALPASDGKSAAVSAQERVRAAREKVDAARRALQEARDNPGAEDVQFLGKVGGGSRSVPSQAYEEKLARLEKAVVDAEEGLRRAEKD
jgi:hypothetical protein